MSDDSMFTIQDALHHGKRMLVAAGRVESPRLDAEILLAFSLQVRRIDLLGNPERVLCGEVEGTYRDLLCQRSKGCPVAYLTGQREFFGISFEVGPGVLVPRPETEHLVEAALVRMPHSSCAGGDNQVKILDVGTGSGCVVCSLLSERPDAFGVGADVSRKALGYARRNAERMGLEDRVHLVQCNRTEAFVTRGRRFSLLVSNPPYISGEQYRELPRTIRQFEPRIALLDPGGGTSFHSEFLREGLRLVSPGGWVLLELGCGQWPRVRRLADASGGYDRVDSVRDLAGHVRVLCARVARQD